MDARFVLLCYYVEHGARSAGDNHELRKAPKDLELGMNAMELGSVLTGLGVDSLIRRADTMLQVHD